MLLGFRGKSCQDQLAFLGFCLWVAALLDKLLPESEVCSRLSRTLARTVHLLLSLNFIIKVVALAKNCLKRIPSCDVRCLQVMSHPHKVFR